MKALTHAEILYLLVGLAILIGLARLFGELMKRFRQPAVVGEILAGVLLGPTILGNLAPGFQEALFPMNEGGLAAAYTGLTTVAVVLFLLVAGLEVDLSIVWRQGKTALSVGLIGMALPFVAGFAIVGLFPYMFGYEPGPSKLVFTLFLATALSISALPVVAKILMDLNIFKSDMGMIMVAAAIVNDLVGWLVFAIVLAMMGTVKVVSLPLTLVILLTIAFTALMLTVGRVVIDRVLPHVYASASWPGGVLSFICAAAFLFAAVTEWIGIHAIFGAFLFGCALGDSRHLRESTRTTLEQFVSFIFVPLFFASIGLKVDFLAHFDLLMVVIVCIVATVTKVLGSALGASICGMNRRESWAIGFGLNARGAMEIILGLLALQAGVIGERLFVALVIMALFTSMASGTLMERVLQRRRPVRLVERLNARHFVPELKGINSLGVIRELVQAAAPDTPLTAGELGKMVWERENIMPTGLENGVAVPHARVPGLKAPVVALGRHPRGVDFDSPDGQSARLVFLILTSEQNLSPQLEILADIARLFNRPSMVEAAMRVERFPELVALLKAEGHGDGH